MRTLLITLTIFLSFVQNLFAQTAFTCDGKAYQTVGNPSHLYQFDFLANTFTDLGKIGPVGTNYELRAMGYNPTDNFVYGFDNLSKKLVKLGVDRVVTSQTITGTYAADFSGVNIVAASFGPTPGILYVMLGGSTNKVYLVNVSTAKVNDYFTTSESFDKGDIIWSNTDSKFYTVGSPASSAGPTHFYSFPAASSTAQATVTKLSTSIPNATTFNYIGALYLDVANNVYGFFNEGGKIYQFNKTTGAATAVRNSGITTTQNDGFSCPASAIPEIAANILPLVLNNFSANKAGSKINLLWQTLTETNTSHFEVEYAVNSTDFRLLDKVAAAGNSSTEKTYNYQTEIARFGNSKTVLFRLKMIDIDGKFTYSKIAAIALTENAAGLSVYPTILKSGENIIINTKEPEAVYIFNATTGNRRLTLSPSSNNNHTSVISTVGWTPGVYAIKTDAEVKKIIIQ